MYANPDQLCDVAITIRLTKATDLWVQGMCAPSNTPKGVLIRKVIERMMMESVSHELNRAASRPALRASVQHTSRRA